MKLVSGIQKPSNEINEKNKLIHRIDHVGDLPDIPGLAPMLFQKPVKLCSLTSSKVRVFTFWVIKNQCVFFLCVYQYIIGLYSPRFLL